MIKKIIVTLLLLTSLVGYAQKNNTSAYSFFGIGDKNSSVSVEQLSMGGVGVAMNSFYRLNMSNPAASSALFYTTYSLGLENKNMSVKDGVDKQNAAASYLSYLTMGIPLGEKGGMYFGLLPNTSVGYSLRTDVFDNDETLIDATLYNGDGGTNKVFFGVGYELFKGFRVGFQGNYLFGKIENSITNQARDVSLATKYQTLANIKGFSFNSGFQYETVIKDDLKLHIGGSFEHENEIDTDGKEYLYSVSLGTFDSPRDTILNNDSAGLLRSPLKTTLGIGLGKTNKWFAEVDFSMQKALEMEGNVFNSYSKVNYDKYSKFAIGGYYIPKFNSITSYWDRVTYRAGLKFEKTGLLIDPSGNNSNFTAIDEFGISFGVGLPMNSNPLSNLNVGFEIGKRGKTNNGLVQENFVNLRLSLSLGDKWFGKKEIF